MRRHLAPKKGRPSGRLRAILAGGLVLGVGATATLAAWTDQEVGGGTFTAGTFSIVGSVDGSTFSDHPTAPGAALLLPVTANAMTPGTTVYALFSVKTAPASVAGNVLLSANAANANGLGTYLTYGVNVIPGTACTAASFQAGTPVVGTGSALTAGASGGNFVAGAGASTVNYCFAITLPSAAPNTAQGTVLSAQWTFLATTS